MSKLSKEYCRCDATDIMDREILFTASIANHEVLLELDTRYLREKEMYMNMLRSDNTSRWSSNRVSAILCDSSCCVHTCTCTVQYVCGVVQIGREYCSLIAQHMAAELEEDFVNACLAVGSFERAHSFKAERSDITRDSLSWKNCE